jgi:hypothetical protein
MKYIITRNGSPVIFSEAEKHSDVARSIGAKSAGFVHINGNEVKCYGESMSLNLKPSEDDERIIRGMLDRN